MSTSKSWYTTHTSRETLGRAPMGLLIVWRGHSGGGGALRMTPLRCLICTRQKLLQLSYLCLSDLSSCLQVRNESWVAEQRLNCVQAALRHSLVPPTLVLLVAVVKVQQLLVELHRRRILEQLLD